jgi:hypothetical protein
MAKDERKSEKREAPKSEQKPPRPEKGLDPERSSRIPDSEPPKEKRIDDL